MISLSRRIKRFFLTRRSTEDVFTRIYDRNRWRGSDSVSGPGSDAAQTRVLVDNLPGLFQQFNVQSILDAPCGDFHWFKEMDLVGIRYTGVDIVAGLIEKNSERYASAQIEFECADIIRDSLPMADLILCRDCLVHLSYADGLAALRNMQASHSTWLLTTTFVDQESNRDIATGEWRMLNLQKAPYNFPESAAYIDEECPHEDGRYRDKMLGLWRLQDLDLN